LGGPAATTSVPLAFSLRSICTILVDQSANVSKCNITVAFTVGSWIEMLTKYSAN
jgi:hypothetical protein